MLLRGRNNLTTETVGQALKNTMCIATEGVAILVESPEETAGMKRLLMKTETEIDDKIEIVIKINDKSEVKTKIEIDDRTLARGRKHARVSLNLPAIMITREGTTVTVPGATTTSHARVATVMVVVVMVVVVTDRRPNTIWRMRRVH
jgi:hypothetical protein